MLLVIAPTMVMAAGANAPAAKWYKLDPRQKYQADYTLKPGETKTLDITSNVPATVGFKTDLTEKQINQYQLKDPNAIAIQLSTRDDAMSALSFDKAELESLKPADEKIAMKIENLGKIPVRVVIYAMPLNVKPPPRGAETNAAAAKWYKLGTDKKYQADYALKPGESKSLDIVAASRASFEVGFESDIGPDLQARLKKDGVKDPIKLSTRDGKEAIASFYGGAMSFTTKNGRLAMKIENQAKVPVKVVIYSEAP